MKAILTPIMLATTIWSCGQPAPSIDFGKAECGFCRMNVVDQKFGAVLLTEKGKQYVFDGVECMVPFMNENAQETTNAALYVCDHAHPGQLIDATTASFAHGAAYRSPMRGDVAAFMDATTRDSTIKALGGEPLDWKATKELLGK